MKSSNTNARTAVSGSTEFPWKWSLLELEKRPKHDPSQRSNGFLTLAGGIVITFAKEILTLITG